MDTDIQRAVQHLAAFADKPLKEYIDLVNTQLVGVTQSTLAYIATVNPAENVLTMIGWSKTAMGFCKIEDKPIVYKLEETGLWGDAIRERKPCITNDYLRLVKPTKKGYPDGHVRVRRHLNLPIFERRKIVLVVGVGNKVAEYTMRDAERIKDLMSEVWKTLKTKL